MIRKVPKEFVLGAAMSAYQMEGAAAAGGREPSVWEDWLRRTVSAAHRHTSDFYHHYEEESPPARPRASVRSRFPGAASCGGMAR